MNKEILNTLTGKLRDDILEMVSHHLTTSSEPMAELRYAIHRHLLTQMRTMWNDGYADGQRAGIIAGREAGRAERAEPRE